MRRLLPLLLLLPLLFMFGCAEETPQAPLQPIEEITEEPETFLESVAANWQLYSLAIIMLTVGMVALAYALAVSFNIRELRVWADVEIAEIVATIFIVAFVIAILSFVHAVVLGIVADDPFLGPYCEDPDVYCPVAIANGYISNYFNSAIDLQKSLFKKNIEVAVKGTESSTITLTFKMWLYFTLSFKDRPWRTIEMERNEQLLNFLGAIIGTLVTQRFFLQAITLKLAPLALLIGIPMRSFFLTRKLGGLLMAFGIGFLLVFPLTYALSLWTANNMLYGASGTGAPGAPCPETCKQFPPPAYNLSNPDQSVDFLALDNMVEREEITYEEYESILNGSVEKLDGVGLASCEWYTNDEDTNCTAICRVLPFPFNGPDCPEQEEACSKLPRGCLLTHPLDLSDPALASLDKNIDIDGCKEECRPLAPMKRDCYPMSCPSSCIDSTGKWKEYVETCEDYELCLENDWLLEGCEEITEERKSDCENLRDDIEPYMENCPSVCAHLPHLMMAGFEFRCPSHCRWILTDGTMSTTCTKACEFFAPTNPKFLWENNLANETCFYIIPTRVYGNPADCESCNYVIDEGLAYKNQMFVNCVGACGATSLKGVETNPATLTNSADGFVGPTDVKSVSKLVVPAFVLPLINLVITIIFIQTLSPMLGGDIDLPGMMRMI